MNRRIALTIFRIAFSMLVIVAAQNTLTRAQTIPLGNLFDDPTGTDLTTAIATDTYGAAADTGDVGVFAVGNTLNQPVQIAPFQMFNFVSAGGGAGTADPVM